MLEPGQSIKRWLAVRQEHTYQINLSVDQFLKVVVEQQGIDVMALVSRRTVIRLQISTPRAVFGGKNWRRWWLRRRAIIG